MSKRHTSQNTQQRLGQYHTTNVDVILEGYEDVVRNKQVIDPFAGGHDLLNWAEYHGASKLYAYDLFPTMDDTIQNDSLKNPPDYSNKIVVSNPPYLSRNKCKDNKDVFDQWGQSDYYKCHLASLHKHGCGEALLIIPSNFFSESRDTIRQLLFDHYHIVSAKYWTQPAFDNTNHCVCCIHIREGHKQIQKFPMTFFPDDITECITLRPEYRYLYGQEFFEDIQRARSDFVVKKTDKGDPPPNTNIVIGLLDNGKWRSGLSINCGDPIYCNPKSFTTYQVTLPDYTLTSDQQSQIVDEFNTRMKYYRDKYHSLFLANYMGPKQKILSRSYVHKLFDVVIQDLNIA